MSEQKKLTETHRYDDIIELPHPISRHHAPLSRWERAAQFSPFAALTGYDAVIAETGRLTADAFELTEEEKLRISDTLLFLRDQAEDAPAVTIDVFLPDKCKEGGEYRRLTGHIRRIDPIEQTILWEDGSVFPFSHLRSMEIV